MMIPDKELYEIVGGRIRMSRQKAGLTQLELADLCGFEKANISRIERGCTNLTIKTLYKICVSLNIKMEDIMTEL
ncbi:MAG: helix-turn-helix transcriptional regulator [Paludibacteraceae bacterium]